MRSNRFSVICTYETEDNSDGITEVISFVEVWVQAKMPSMASFVRTLVKAIENLENEYGIGIAISDVDGENVILRLVDIDASKYDIGKTLNTISLKFLRMIEMAGYIVVARGCTEVEYSTAYYDKSLVYVRHMN